MKKLYLTVAAVLAAVLIPAGTALAAGRSITDVTLTFTSTIQSGERGGTVTAEAQSSRCRVLDTALLNDVDVWNDRDAPQVRVLLAADDDYRFTDAGKHVFSLNGEQASFLSAEIKDDGARMAVTVRLGTLDSTGLPYWTHDDNGWWYVYADGTCPVNTWQEILYDWYYFDENGYRKSGWVFWNDKWYYCDDETGAMLTSTRTPDGYYVNHRGEWVKNR